MLESLQTLLTSGASPLLRWMLDDPAQIEWKCIGFIFCSNGVEMSKYFWLKSTNFKVCVHAGHSNRILADDGFKNFNNLSGDSLFDWPVWRLASGHLRYAQNALLKRHETRYNRMFALPHIPLVVYIGWMLCSSTLWLWWYFHCYPLKCVHCKQCEWQSPDQMNFSDFVLGQCIESYHQPLSPDDCIGIHIRPYCRMK